MMATLNLTIKRVLVTLNLVFIVQIASASTSEAVKRDFDTIREFQSYEPSEDKWYEIEKFKAVEILKDPKEKREDEYIHRGFWAYDEVTKRWYKVDIAKYGYERKKLPAIAARRAKAKSSKKASSTGGFWKNLTLGIRGGAGGTFHIVRPNKFGVTAEGKKYYLQTAQQESQKERKGYKPGWFGDVYTARVSLPAKQKKGKDGKWSNNNDLKTVKNDSKIVLRGEGLSIPITAFTHYTFFKRVRLGGGAELEINHLKKLMPKEDADQLSAFDVQLDHEWFYNIAWFGLLGIRMSQDFFLDLQVGQNYNVGADLQRWIDKQTYIYDGWLFGMGVTHEYKLNNYFKWVTRVGADWKLSDDTPQDIQDGSSSIGLHQISGHLDLGIQFNFGKNVEEKKYKTEGNKASGNKKSRRKKNKLSEAGRSMKKAKNQSDQLKGKINWNLR